MAKKKLLTRAAYFKRLKRFLPSHCSFCDSENNDNLIIKKGNLWDLMFCLAPYWQYHLLLVPRRHFIEFAEMTSEELDEFIHFCNETLAKLRKMKLHYNDGAPIDRYLFFWRSRDNQFDPITKVIKPNHFHFHIAPEKEHLLDEVLDNSAHTIDTEEFIKLFNKIS